jgi:hypothetical protein
VVQKESAEVLEDHTDSIFKIKSSARNWVQTKQRLGFLCLLLVCHCTFSSTLKMEATYSSKMSVNFYQNIGRHIPRDSNLHSYCCENLKSNFYIQWNLWSWPPTITDCIFCGNCKIILTYIWPTLHSLATCLSCILCISCYGSWSHRFLLLLLICTN